MDVFYLNSMINYCKLLKLILSKNGKSKCIFMIILLTIYLTSSKKVSLT